LNDSELPVLAALFGLAGEDSAQLAEMAERFELDVVALTRGPKGSLLYRGGRWSECGTRHVSVKDTVGAGDAFTAALALGLLQKMDLDEINRSANEVARHVCSCEGATPALPAALRALFDSR
jgi:fructokinase